MKKLTEIENNLNQTTLRLDELAEMRLRLNNRLKTLQDGFVNGKTPLAEVQAEQSALDTLTSSITALEVNKSELQTAFDELAATETRATLIASARVAGLEAETLFDEALADRRELDDAIGKLSEKFTDRMFEFHSKKREYLKLRGQFPPDTKTPGLSNDVVLLLEKNHLNFPPVRFGLSVQAACQVIEKEMEKEEIAKSRAAR
jgi:chromosome segregation ATPase